MKWVQKSIQVGNNMTLTEKCFAVSGLTSLRKGSTKHN